MGSAVEAQAVIPAITNPTIRRQVSVRCLKEVNISVMPSFWEDSNIDVQD